MLFVSLLGYLLVGPCTLKIFVVVFLFFCKSQLWAMGHTLPTPEKYLSLLQEAPHGPLPLDLASPQQDEDDQ